MHLQSFDVLSLNFYFLETHFSQSRLAAQPDGFYLIGGQPHECGADAVHGNHVPARQGKRRRLPGLRGKINQVHGRPDDGVERNHRAVKSDPVKERLVLPLYKSLQILHGNGNGGQVVRFGDREINDDVVPEGMFRNAECSRQVR